MNAVIYASIVSFLFPLIIRKIANNINLVAKRQIVAFAVVFSILFYESYYSSNESLSQKLMEIFCFHIPFNQFIRHIIVGLISFSSLFCVPLYYYIILYIPYINNKRNLDLNLYSLRDYFIAPILEEVVYRYIFYYKIVKYYCYSHEFYIGISSVYFGLSHIAVGLDQLEHKNTASLIQVVKHSGVSIFFASLLGLLNSYTFTKTKNLILCILFHSGCNILGDPFTPLLTNPCSSTKFKQLVSCYFFGLVLFLMSIINFL